MENTDYQFAKLRLSRYFEMSERFWTGLQEDYDREMAKDRLGDAIQPVASR